MKYAEVYLEKSKHLYIKNIWKQQLWEDHMLQVDKWNNIEVKHFCVLKDLKKNSIQYRLCVKSFKWQHFVKMLLNIVVVNWTILISLEIKLLDTCCQTFSKIDKNFCSKKKIRKTWAIYFWY